MAHLIDKSALVAEIERRIKETESMQPKFDQFWAGQISAFKGILKILDILEVKEMKEPSDVFIEKAENFLEMLGYGFTITDNITHTNYGKEQLIEDFKNYMEGE